MLMWIINCVLFAKNNLVKKIQYTQKYFLQYKDDTRDTEGKQFDKEDCNDITQEQFRTRFSQLDLENNGYTVSCCRHSINTNLTETKLTNTQVKKTLN